MKTIRADQALFFIDTPCLIGGTTVEKAMQDFCRNYVNVLANYEGLLHILEEMTEFEETYRQEHRGCRPVPVSLDQERFGKTYKFHFGKGFIPIKTMSYRCIL